MTPNDRLRSWAERAARLHSTVQTLVPELQSVGPPPLAGVSPEDAAAVLVETYRLLGLPDPGVSANVATEINSWVSGQLDLAPDAARSAYTKLAGVIIDAVGAAKGRHPDLVYPADFGQLVSHSTDMFTSSKVTILAPLSGLQASHPLRTALPADEYYQADEGPSLVLGHALRTWQGGAAARPWYFRSSVLSLTRQWRAVQRKQEDEVRRQEEVDRLDRLRRWEESPQGREAELKKRVAALEAQLAATGSARF